MLMNIMYYGMDTSSSSDQQDGLKLGPFINITVQQLSIGIITNLIVFPPTLLLVQLFRRSKRRRPRLAKIKTILNQNIIINDLKEIKSISPIGEKEKRPKKELKFPWWCKIIAYILSFAFGAVSAFFVIVKGIEFGNEKVTKWLTSVIISFFSSVFLTQPIQVNKQKRIYI